MIRRVAAVGAAIVVGAALLAVPPQRPAELAPVRYLVVENSAVVLDSGVQVALGTPVGALPAGFSLEAYDAATGSGLVQWRPRTGAPVLLLASEARVHAISLAFEPRFRTSRGIGVGDSASRLVRAYGEGLRDTRAASPTPGPDGYLLPPTGDGVTYFDTSCTGRVNAIGLALGARGLALLGSFWHAPDTCE